MPDKRRTEGDIIIKVALEATGISPDTIERRVKGYVEHGTFQEGLADALYGDTFGGNPVTLQFGAVTTEYKGRS